MAKCYQVDTEGFETTTLWGQLGTCGVNRSFTDVDDALEDLPLRLLEQGVVEVVQFVNQRHAPPQIGILSQTTSGWAVFWSETCVFFTVFTFCTIPT